MTADAASPTPRLVAATVHGRYFALPPAGAPPRRWLVGLHGYGQNAREFLELLRRVPGSEAWLIVSIQALHPFYRGRTNVVVANWMTRQDREHAIADNVAYVDAVLDDIEREHGAPRGLVLAGFSQGVAMAYRAALLGRRPCDAILAAAGDVPPELKSGAARDWPAVRIVVGRRDTFYTPGALRRDLEFFESIGVPAVATTFDGGHEWQGDVLAAAGALLAEVAPAATSAPP